MRGTRHFRASRYGRSFWWHQAVAAAVIAVALNISYTMTFPGTNIGLLFPAAGLGLGLTLLWGIRDTLAGMLISVLAIDLPRLLEAYGPVKGWFVEAAGMAGITIPMTLCALWFRRDPVRLDVLASVRGVLRLVLVGGVLTFGVNAISQVTTMWLAGGIPTTAYWDLFFNFWFSDVASVVGLTSFCLVWRRPWPLGGPRLLAGLVAASVIVGVAVFWLPKADSAYFEYVTILLVVWAAFVLGQRGATTSAVILSAALVWATSAGRGRYIDLPIQQVLTLVNLYIISVSLTGLVLAAVLEERAQSVEEVRQLNQELEQRVARRTAALERTNKELEAFASSASHDLRAPLRRIDSYAQILRKEYGGRLDAEGRRYLGKVFTGAAQMHKLIDDLLDFSRSAGCEMAMEPVEMTALVKKVFSELRADAPEREIALSLDDLPVAMCDRALMRQVLRNLLSNAIKYTATRPSALIQVSCACEGAEQLYSVADNGIGFDARYAYKIFEAFERLQPSGQFEGTGIGLAIVRRIIERHGGRVWAEGRTDQGATFHFSLPAPRGPDAAEPDAPSSA